MTLSEPDLPLPAPLPAPLAIGGVGGSGTRVVAKILMESGCYLGADLNQANDNLWFSLLFRRPEIVREPAARFEQLAAVFLKGMRGGTPFTTAEERLVLELAAHARPDISQAWLEQRASSLLAASERAPTVGHWGWKEPNTHVVIDRLLRAVPTLKYVHVVRNGLDMAYSANQNQLRLWGPHLLGSDTAVSPRNSLRFWHLANRRVTEIFAPAPARFLLLNFDRLCGSPEAEVARLLAFAGQRADAAALRDLCRLIQTPPSTGRFKRHGTSAFAPEDLRYARELGFDTRDA